MRLVARLIVIADSDGLFCIGLKQLQPDGSASALETDGSPWNAVPEQLKKSRA
jgi:hypothetical protein